MRTNRPRTPLLLALTIVAGLALAACGGDPPPATGSTWGTAIWGTSTWQP